MHPPTEPEELEPGALPDKIGEADLSKLNLAISALFDRLRESQDQTDKRLAVCNALGAFSQFITRFRTPYMQSLQVPILRLMDALAGLEQNRVEPILQPVQTPRGGRAPSSDSYASLKGQAVATVELLVRSSLERRAARLTWRRSLASLV
jgi:hypothetical protein